MITACGFVTILQIVLTWNPYLQVATVITACGFVTEIGFTPKPLAGCNSDYRLRFCNRSLDRFHNIMIPVATVITACGFVTESWTSDIICFTRLVATVITACGFVTLYLSTNASSPVRALQQ